MQRIAALRKRLELVPAGADSLDRVALQVESGTRETLYLDAATRPADPAGTATPVPTPVRLTARAARLVRTAHEHLRTLRTLAGEPVLQGDESDPLLVLHAESVALLDTVLRNVQALPAPASQQLRHCEGLEAVLDVVAERVGIIHAGVNHRRQENERIDLLADLLRHIAAGETVELTSLMVLAETLLNEARDGQPLRFHYAAPTDPARFAAAHGLVTAQVLGRLLLQDPAWQTQIETAVAAALVHDVGMVCVPAEVLGKPGPLDADERRLVEKHTTVGGPMLGRLWPGGGWTVEAATDHHERIDGTGYPLGKKEIQLAAYVRLLAVCDVYAAVCAPRPYRPALDTRAALTETLLLAERQQLDRQQAERLLLLSFYPPGSVVELNDGAVAVVLAAHAGQRGLTNPGRPIISLLTDARGQALVLPRVLDLTTHTDRSVVRALGPTERRHFLGKRFPELV
jgi:hypothetical protein